MTTPKKQKEDHPIPNSGGLSFLLLEASLAQQHYDSKKAVFFYQEAFKIEPDNPYVIYGLAYTLKNLQLYEQALPLYQRLDVLRYNLPIVKNELGLIYHAKKNLDEAKRYYQEAISLGLSGAKWNLAALELSSTPNNQNWRLFEDRFSVFQQQPSYLFETPTKKEDLLNKIVLVTYEQGMGDTLQFCRWLVPLQKITKHIFCLVQKPLLDFLKFNFPEITFIATTQEIKKADYHISLLSLPALFFPEQPTNVKLRPPKTKDQFFIEKIKNETRLKVGFVWHGGEHKGSPEAKFTHDRRNISLDNFIPLFSDPQFAFYSLQVGGNTSQENMILYKNQCFDYTDSIQNFGDTADFISNLDIIITTDTSMAHLAGTLEIPVIVFNRYDGCWRWGNHQKTTAFYPTMTLLNQKEPNNWSEPMLDAHLILCALAKNKKEWQNMES